MNDWKNDFPMEDMSPIVVLQDETGEDVEFQFLDQIEYNGGEYMVLMPVEDFDGEVVILQVIEGEEEGEEQFASVEDDDVLQAVFELFREKFADMLNFSDEDDAE